MMIKKELHRLVTSVVGVIVLLSFFIKQATINEMAAVFQNWGIVVGAFALGMASLNLMRVHFRKIKDRSRDWFTSVILLVFLIGVTIAGIIQSTSGPIYSFWFNNLYNTCHATVGSLLAFYVATAAYRAFRAKNTESVVLLVSAIIVMVGMAPIGYLLSPRFPAIADWLINIMNMSGQRGIMITAGIGGIAASIRVLVGIDRR
jgi:positive regulator of sigma E activity